MDKIIKQLQEEVDSFVEIRHHIHEIGGGDDPGIPAPHNPGYDYNDEIIPLAAAFWAKLTESYLK